MHNLKLLYALLGVLSLHSRLSNSSPTAAYPRNYAGDVLPDTHSRDMRTAIPRVHTNQGIIQGTHLSDQVSAYLGVPYAQPPVGDLRFRPPLPLVSGNEANTTVLDASQFGPVCWQFHYRSVLGNNLVETTPQSEDCLSLNVFVPRNPNNTTIYGLPTLLWIYGGSFSEGGGSMPAYNPQNLVASQSDIIVVTINARSSIFGFPNSPAISIDHQNPGIRDMRAALEWVRDNIAAFGGDPNKITLGGESSGADSVAAMAYSYEKDPIARAFLLESGQPLAALGYSDPTVEYYRVATTLGCRNKNDSVAELHCMKTIPAAELRHAISNTTFSPYGFPNGGSPMIDNVTLFTPEEYRRRGEAGEFAKLPVMMGMNNREGDGVVNWDPKRGLNKTLSDIFHTTFFECPISQEASYRPRHDVPIWKYRYFGTFQADTFWCWLGSYHVSEVPMLLGSYEDLKPARTITDYERSSAKLLQNAVGTFVRDPAKGLSDNLGWPMYSPDQTTLVELFHKNEPVYRLEDPRKYNEVCDDPPSIPYAEWAEPAPDQIPECFESRDATTQ